MYQQKIDLGGSSIVVTLLLTSIFDATTDTIPFLAAHCVSTHSLGILPTQYEIRIYQMTLADFPSFEEINANDPSSKFTTDSFIVFRKNANHGA